MRNAALLVALALAHSNFCSIANAEEPVSFPNDVVPILTKHACNSGGCHGKSTGQNGFRLSLLGFEPGFDHKSLVHDSRGRRAFAAAPERSMLLSKATASVPHGGGKRFATDSEDYRILYRWLAEGATGPISNERVLQRISVSPDAKIMRAASTQQLKVTAHYSDGKSRDVTRQALYESNEPLIGDANGTGIAKTHSRGGLFAIMVRFGVQTTVFRGTVPFEKLSTELVSPSAAQSKIDQHLFAQWNRLGVAPSKLADDFTFIRRVTLDVCGTLPTRQEVEEFAADKSDDKRVKLIDSLLERPEYASYFALKWAAILQNRGRSYSSRSQREGTALFSAWIRDSIVENMPYDEFVSEILTATGSQAENPPTIWYRSVRTTPEYVESIAQAFLGVRIQCAQCHHHPSERWSQADYYGLAAVFGRVGRKGGFADAEVPTDEIIYVKQAGRIVHPRTGETMKPRPLGGPDFKLGMYQDPRQNLAKWMTSKQNPFFAKAMANRMWGHFLGRGIVHPIDDSRSTNPPSNPELLAELAREFADSDYDVKHLIRAITTSHAYALSAIPNDSNRLDTQSYSRFALRRLPAEVLLDGFSQVLDVPTDFSGGPGKFPVGTRAIELPDENVPMNFLDVFGRPARTSACECERSDDPALGQALELINSTEIQKKLTAKDGYLAKLLANDKPHEANVQDIFFRVFARKPTSREMGIALKFLTAAKDRAAAYRSLIWSLLATNEFMFNR
jgi:hypothetical protein